VRLRNILVLARKELITLLFDPILMALIIFSLTLGVQPAGKDVNIEVSNASVAIIDEDNSVLSARLRDAIFPPFFMRPRMIQRDELTRAIGDGSFVFVIEIPPNFQADVAARKSPEIGIVVDATAMTQAGLGTQYLSEIFLRETAAFLHESGAENLLPILLVPRLAFNGNGNAAWSIAVMQTITNLTVLSIILVGAAVVRERERGTIEHLLSMPLSASELAVAKIGANALVVVIGGILSLWWVTHIWLGVPVLGNILFVCLGMAIYIFAVSSLGMWLATLVSSMSEFALVAIPVYAVVNLLSGAATPVENMPQGMQMLVRYLPTNQFVEMMQGVVSRGAEGWTFMPQLGVVLLWGGGFSVFAVIRFRAMLEMKS
jgi:ABC-2 type transport system permease protein